MVLRRSPDVIVVSRTLGTHALGGDIRCVSEDQRKALQAPNESCWETLIFACSLNSVNEIDRRKCDLGASDTHLGRDCLHANEYRRIPGTHLS